MSTSDRELQRRHFQDLIDVSDERICKGTLYLTYERLKALRYVLNWINKGDNHRLRSCKHWRLVLKLGLDYIELDFNENSERRGEGVLTARKFIETEEVKLDELGEMEVDTKTVFTDLMAMFLEMSWYSVKSRNCQHFVILFVQRFDRYMISKTKHYEGIHSKDPRRETSASIFGSLFKSDPDSIRQPD
ncbi:hypothetical protein EC991_004109 [Linnemannia zychae]|nr:hypothetical protein EC991_004109 [Linnemannia zychae]